METKRIQTVVDLKQLQDNMRAIRNFLPAGVRIIVSLAGNAYGLGAEICAPILEPFVDAFAVSDPAEADAVLTAITGKPILVLGDADRTELEFMLRRGIRFSVWKEEQAQAISEKAAELGLQAYLHLAVDLGLSDVGMPTTWDSADMVARIAALPGLQIEGIYSGFPYSGEAHRQEDRRQLDRFLRFLGRLKERGIEPLYVHLADSEHAMALPESRLSAVRLASAVYGILQAETEGRQLTRPILTMTGHLTEVKEVRPGTSIGEGGAYTAEYSMTIGLVSCGYGDGYPGLLSGCGEVLIRGRRSPILGNIGIDRMMVDVSEIPDARPGDTVTLVGRDGAEEITLEELSRRTGLSHRRIFFRIAAPSVKKYVFG